MRSKRIYWTIVVFLVLVLTGIGFLFFRDESFPFWVIQGIALLSLLFAFFLYNRLVRPYHLLLNGMALLKEQDFATHLRPVRNRDADEVIRVFNRMISHLRNERLAVREKNQFLDLLISASPQGIIILDFDKNVTDINPAGMKILGVDHLAEVKGKRLSELSFDLAPALANLRPKDDLILRGMGGTAYRCARSSFVDQGFDHPFILIEELTHELLRVEKESYERIIRMMSHEVNNSVGAIGSTLNVISEIFTQNGETEWKDVLEAVDASYDRCGNLSKFISNLSHVVKIPEPTRTWISLNEQARAVEALTRMECQRRNIRLELSLVPDDPMICLDGIQFEQVLVNIVKNAYEAIGRDGVIRISTARDPLSLTIEDNGPGLEEETRKKLFTPFFTTKPTGYGIGLMFVREVLVNHGYRFDLSTREGLTRFEIFF